MLKESIYLSTPSKSSLSRHSKKHYQYVKPLKWGKFNPGRGGASPPLRVELATKRVSFLFSAMLQVFFFCHGDCNDVMKRETTLAHLGFSARRFRSRFSEQIFLNFTVRSLDGYTCRLRPTFSLVFEVIDTSEIATCSHVQGPR